MALLKSGVCGSEFSFSMALTDQEQVNTNQLLVDQVPWRFMFIRKENILNVCLYCDYANTSADWWIEAEGRLKIISFKDDGIHVEVKVKMGKFMDAIRMSQVVNCIAYEDLSAPENEFIQNGRVAIQCSIFSKPVMKEPCQLSNVVSCTSQQFTLKVENVSKITTVNSKKYKLCGMNWFAKIQRTGEKMEIYLSKGETDQDFTLTVDVKFKAKLLSFSKLINPVEKHFRHLYSVDWAYSYGWPSFVTWSTLMEEDKQYVRNDAAFFVFSIDVGPLKPIMSQLALTLKDKVLVQACPICFRLFDGEGAADIVATGCGHLFCEPCIVKSMGESPNCPLCVALVSVTDFRKIYF